MTAQDSGVVIRSTTNLVQVRLVAEDSKGRPVTDLQKADFKILDDGKPQPITLFTAERSATVSQSLPGSAAKQAEGAAEPAGGYALLLLDWLNTGLTDRVQAKDQAIRLLKRFQARQKVGLYLLGHDSRLIRGFTSDMAELAQAVEEAGIEFGRVEDMSRPSAHAKPDVSMEGQIFLWQNRVLDTLRAFGDIAEMLGRLPGRKSLIWLSNGFPMAVDGSVVGGAKPGELVFFDDIERALGKLNRADVAVYGIDAAGLSVLNRSWSGTLEEFASRTGGTAFFARNDLDEGMRLALEDMRTGYTLGFHVPENAVQGLHALQVRVNRPGLKLRYRESYDWPGNVRVR